VPISDHLALVVDLEVVSDAKADPGPGGERSDDSPSDDDATDR
jgi:hypothetical protein